MPKGKGTYGSKRGRPPMKNKKKKSKKKIMSKGSDPRPMKVNKKTFDANWDKIFKTKRKTNDRKSIKTGV